MINYTDLEYLFLGHDHKWSIDGELQSPTAKDIEQTVAEAMRLLALEDSTNSTPQLEVGHLIVQLNQGHYDVYMHVGEASPTKETP